MLMECEQTGESIIVVGLDVSRDFASGLHHQLLLIDYNCGLDVLIVLSFCNLYHKLKVKIKINLLSGTNISSIVALVQKEISQRAISPPILCNNSVVEAQQVVKRSFLYHGIDLSSLNYPNYTSNLSCFFFLFLNIIKKMTFILMKLKLNFLLSFIDVMLSIE